MQLLSLQGGPTCEMLESPGMLSTSPASNEEDWTPGKAFTRPYKQNRLYSANYGTSVSTSGPGEGVTATAMRCLPAGIGPQVH